jgi:predicted Rossmann-fold nucleotide-binding protein
MRSVVARSARLVHPCRARLFSSKTVARGVSAGASGTTKPDVVNLDRQSPDAVAAEMRACFSVVQRMGRGAVYLGSARVPEDHPHFGEARALARDVAATYDVTTWSGLGAGMMEAVTQGGMDAGKPVAGFMILLEAGGGEQQASRKHPYLPDTNYHTASFFSARKHGLVDAGVRVKETDRTVFVALPGGVGTLDEIFEVLALMQLRRLGSSYDVPFIIMNYDGCFDGLLQFLEKDMVAYGALREHELKPHWKACATNEHAMAYLAEFYAKN